MKIPVVFAFDDNYALAASVAMRSLVESRLPGTEYEVVVLHGGLSARTRRRIETICPVRWIDVPPDRFARFPMGWGGRETWYRLLLAELLPDCDRAIWSDVDVLFLGDVSRFFRMDLCGAEWAGVPMERDGAPERQNNSWGRHDAIYSPGFMVADLKRWRETDFLARCERVVAEYGPRLTMCDLDVLNIAAARIAPLPLSCCVLERLAFGSDIAAAREYAALRSVYSDDAIRAACRDPLIYHFAGPTVKVWLRAPWVMPTCYREAMRRSPFGGRLRELTWLFRTAATSFRSLAALLLHRGERQRKARRTFGIYRRSLAGGFGLSRLAADSVWQPS